MEGEEAAVADVSEIEVSLFSNSKGLNWRFTAKEIFVLASLGKISPTHGDKSNHLRGNIKLFTV